MARIKDFISGGVAQPVPKQESFDLKATQEKITGYLQQQVDEVLMGTPLHGTGSVQAVLGSGSAVGLNLHLLAPEPLEEQTVKLLASHLSTRISSPVELHGVVKLEARDYALSLELPDSQSGLDRKGQRRLNDLVATLLKRPDLDLRASLSAHGIAADALKASKVWREVDNILSRSHLKYSQWLMETTPVPTVAPTEATPSASAPAVPKAKGPAPPASNGPV